MWIDLFASVRVALFLWIALACAAGCGGSSPTVDDCGGLPRTQGAMQPCCTEYGIDACGADLFCAAFDGRTQATCYLDYSQQAGQACTADQQCLSRSCNITAGACRATPAAPCTVDVGCSSEIDGYRYVCVGGTCWQSDGQEGDYCGNPSDCADGLLCAAGKCSTGETGSECDSDSDCTHRGSCILNQCKGGGPGDYCTSDDQCDSGFCIVACSAGDSDSDFEQIACGHLTPQSGMSGVCLDAACNSSADCQTGSCVANPGLGAGNGQCSIGDNWGICQSDAECQAGHHCVHSGLDSSFPVGVCTDGTEHAPCAGTSDCASCRTSSSYPFGSC